MTTSIGLSLTGTEFTAYELPTKKWMKWMRPKVRLHVRGKRGHFVSPIVKVNNWNGDTEKHVSCTYWPWNVDERPSFAEDEVFEIIIERRFLLGYERIRRTKSVTVGQVPCSESHHDLYALQLYDGQYSAAELEDKIDIGRITFRLCQGG